MSVTDAIVVVDGPEVPILDGSAHEFAAYLLADGMGAIGHIDSIVIREAVRVEDGRGGVIEAMPTSDPVPTLTYKLDYGPGAPIEPQEFSWSGNEGLYYSQVAGARTFSLRPEAEAMQNAGLFRDFGPEDLLVVGDDGRPISNAFRYHDEPARHKLLDLIGDLALLHRPIEGVVTATRSGHALTHEFSRMLAERWG
jgi:UDP-3-O-[3-hydroxymyristoyl] N-acetylglucosamine deacetylase/UDP-3-O-[3-hydroxymyristoyl] N-acetylglucosamine deacetylase/3-hydroxyacyl-[acyl-carrier-protein] dehydratase